FSAEPRLEILRESGCQPRCHILHDAAPPKLRQHPGEGVADGDRNFGRAAAICRPQTVIDHSARRRTAAHVAPGADDFAGVSLFIALDIGLATKFRCNRPDLHTYLSL